MFRYTKRTLILEIVTIGAALVLLAPFWILVVGAFKTGNQVLTTSSFAPPTSPTLSNFTTLLSPSGSQSGNIWQGLLSSVLITAGTIIALVTLGSAAAYVLARRTRAWSNRAYYLFLGAIVLPTQLGTLPLYIGAKHLGLVGNPWGMVVVYTGFLLPLSVFLYAGFYRRLPLDYEEAASLDGASRLRVFARVVFPLMGPATGSVAILAGLIVWNDFFTALIFLNGSRWQTLPVVMYNFVGSLVSQWNLIFAVVIISMVPILVFYVFTQKKFIQAYAGGLKGMSENYDVVIVGSGPVGSTYARILAEQAADLRILMLEAGPRLTAVPGVNVRNETDPAERARLQAASEGPDVAADPDHRSEYSPRPGTYRVRRRRPGTPDQDDMPDASVSTNVGGMGAHWTCACPSPYGSERIAFIKDAEWADLEAEAARLLHVTTEGFEPTTGARAALAGLGAAFDDGRPTGRQVQPMPLACTPRRDASPLWSGADTVLGRLAAGAHDGFELRADTTVRRILHSGGRATGVEIASRDGARAEISARVVVVAADALRTPQLLWASGIRPAALGRYLNDQPQVVAAVSVRTEDGGTSSGSTGLNYGEGEADQRDKLAGVAWVPFVDGLHPFHGQVMQLDASPIDLGVTDPSGVVVGLGWFCAKDIRAEDRLKFDDAEPDSFGLPAIRIRYQLTDRDRAQIEAAMAQQRRAAEALGGFIPRGEPRLLPAGTSLHYQGTVRMGEADDGTSVCDPASAVWGLSGLYVGGNGVIPTATACNPTLTSVALAVRAARVIAEGA